MNQCGLCGKTAVETHHILHQEDANSHGFVKRGVSVHHASNLIPLCEECHQKQHHANEEVCGYVQTTEGVEVRTRSKTRAKRSLQDCEVMIEDVKKSISFFPMVGWKKKTKNGVWRATSWEKVCEALRSMNVSVESEADAQNTFMMML
jgi:hypothetical protein